MSFANRLRQRLQDKVKKLEGEYMVDPTIAESRMETCRVCPSLSALNQCRECGCFMPAKTRLNNVKCPLGKWGNVE